VVVDVVPFRPSLLEDLRNSILAGREIGRVACDVNGRLVLSPPIHNGHTALSWEKFQVAAAKLGCDFLRGITTFHTHPHVPEVIMSDKDRNTLAQNRWMDALCVVAKNGIGCWPRRR
jgi:hypothetical protein